MKKYFLFLPLFFLIVSCSANTSQDSASRDEPTVPSSSSSETSSSSSATSASSSTTNTSQNEPMPQPSSTGNTCTNGKWDMPASAITETFQSLIPGAEVSDGGITMVIEGEKFTSINQYLLTLTQGDMKATARSESTTTGIITFENGTYVASGEETVGGITEWTASKGGKTFSIPGVPRASQPSMGSGNYSCTETTLEFQNSGGGIRFAFTRIT